MWYDWPALSPIREGQVEEAWDPDVSPLLVIYVADTGNHRIRKIQGGIVTCFAGLCGSGINSETYADGQATPQPGFADGPGAIARFDSPMGIAVDAAGVVFVADTGNHLIRRIEPDGTVITLAGRLDIAERAPDGISILPAIPSPYPKKQQPPTIL